MGVGVQCRPLYESSLVLEDFTAFVDPLPAFAAAHAAPAPSEFSDLAVKAVTFTHPRRTSPSLRDASLRIGRGEEMAMVGENGSGKTTMAKLLAGLYLPDSGRCRGTASTLPRATRTRSAARSQ